MIKKFSIWILLIALVLIVSACGASEETSGINSEGNENTGNNAEETKEAASDEVFTLKFATSAPADHAFSKLVYIPFYERIEELSEGRIKIEWYPGEQLGKGSDYLSLTGDGVADLSYISPANTPSEFPIASILGLPGIFQGEDIGIASDALLNVLKQDTLLNEYLNHNVRPVAGMWSPPAEVFLSNGEELRTPEDMKGLKIATSSSMTTAIFDELGAAPVQLNAADMFSAIDNGVVDGTNLYASTVKGFGMSELVNSASIGLGMGTNVLNIIVNEDTYQSLPADLQEAIMQAGAEISTVGAQGQYDDDLAAYEEFSGSGVNVYELTDEEKAQWQEFYDGFIEGYIPEDITDQFYEVYDAFNEEFESLK